MVKAIIIRTDDAPVTKAVDDRGKSKALPEEDPWFSMLADGKIVEPPFDLLTLSVMEEYSTVLRQCIESFEVNVEGFGYRLEPVINPFDPEVSNKLKAEIQAERIYLTNLLNNIGLGISLIGLRRRMRHDVEATGNAFWELIPTPSNQRIDLVNHIPSYQCRLSPLDKEETEFKQNRILLQPDGSYKWDESITAFKRFRRFVQVRDGSIGGHGGWQRIYFKEPEDPRVISWEDGEVLAESPEAAKKEGIGVEKWANPMVHWSIYSARTPYGIPRYMGTLISLLGDRFAEEVNYTTLKSNAIPSMIVAVSNGQLTQETIDRMTDFAREQIQNSANYSKFLVLEAEGLMEGQDTGQMKIDVKPLASVQNKDQLFQEYSKNNRQKIRESMRLAPIFVGDPQAYTRDNAQTSRRVTDEQVFAPERLEVDWQIRRAILCTHGIRYHQFYSNGPNITDDQALIRLLVAAEKTGGMTPRVAARIINDILGQTVVEKWHKSVNPDIPFSLQMAEAVKNQASPTEPGQQVTALKNMSDEEDVLVGILSLRDKLLGELDRRASVGR